MKIKQIRNKKLIFDNRNLSKKELIILSFTYKIIIYFYILQKCKCNNKEKELKKTFYNYIYELKEYNYTTEFIEKLINYINNYISKKTKLNIYYMFFLGYLFATESVPFLSKDTIDLNFIKDFIKNNILNIKQFLSFKIDLPESYTFPYFRTYINDIVYDNTIIIITCNHKINFIPTVNKVIKEIKQKKINKKVDIIFINPRFKLIKKIEFF